MFQRLLGVLIFGLMTQSAVAQSWNCDHFVGAWRFEGDDYSMSAQRTVILQFFSDHRFLADLQHKGRNSAGRRLEAGRWQCRGRLQTLHVEMIDGVAVNSSVDYEILELTPVNFIMRSTPENCEGVVSDCPTTYEYIRQ